MIALTAQVPGYLGKRFTLTGNILFGFPQIGDNAANYNSTSDLLITFNKSFRVTADYVVGQKTNLSLGFKMINFGFRRDDLGYPYDQVSKLSFKTFQFGLKSFLGGNIAPLKNYIMYGVSLHLAKESDPDHVIDNFTPYAEDSVMRFGGFHFGVGTNYIIKDRVIFNIALETDLPLSSDFDTNKAIIRNKFTRNSYLNLSLGLGVLLF